MEWLSGWNVPLTVNQTAFVVLVCLLLFVCLVGVFAFITLFYVPLTPVLHRTLPLTPRLHPLLTQPAYLQDMVVIESAEAGIHGLHTHTAHTQQTSEELMSSWIGPGHTNDA